MTLRCVIAIIAGGFFVSVPGSVWAGQTERATWPGCRASQLALAKGLDISPATGQHPLVLRLTNRAQRPCSLRGYPTVEFTDERGSIPFSIGQGGDQVVTPRPPALVVRPSRSAFVLLNKYRCDLGDVRIARTLRLGVPGDKARLTLGLRSSFPHYGFCGRGDPGSTVVTSPFEPTRAAVLRQR